MQFASYLYFDGNCAEAFAFYARLFGGTTVYQGTFGEMPSDARRPPLAEADRARIMHVHPQVGTQSLMGSDVPRATRGQGPDTCGGYHTPQGMWVSIQVEDETAGRHVFDGLARGGNVAMPFTRTFFSPGFGMVTDRFGIPWMVNVRPTS